MGGVDEERASMPVVRGSAGEDDGREGDEERARMALARGDEDERHGVEEERACGRGEMRHGQGRWAALTKRD